MTVYALAQLRIHDRERYGRYASRFMESLAPFEGRLLAADDGPQVVEGAWDRDRVVLIAFPDAGEFERWRGSDLYREIAVDRQAATEGPILLVAGLRPWERSG